MKNTKVSRGIDPVLSDEADVVLLKTNTTTATEINRETPIAAGTIRSMQLYFSKSLAHF
jgi:hypothetical protein